MTEIPKDIVLAADAACGAMWAKYERETGDEEILRCVEEAIFAERKRCANLATRTYIKDPFRFELGVAVAERILSGEQP